METTFGLPRYVLPSVAEIQGQILRFVREALQEDYLPVLYGYSLGKAQEAVALLQQHGIPCVQHASVAKMSEACRAAGLALVAPEIYESEVPSGHVLVAPPSAAKLKKLQNVERKRTAMLSGWGLNPAAHYRYRTDTVIPLSDHADYAELVETVERVAPALVYTIHGSTKEFSADLRQRGVEAWCMRGYDQLELF